MINLIYLSQNNAKIWKSSDYATLIILVLQLHESASMESTFGEDDFLCLRLVSERVIQLEWVVYKYTFKLLKL